MAGQRSLSFNIQALQLALELNTQVLESHRLFTAECRVGIASRFQLLPDADESSQGQLLLL